MTIPEARDLLGLDLNAFWRSYIATGLMAGLRPGELLGLRWEDVDFAAGVIRIRKCLKALPDPAAGKRRLVLETLKTERSRRTIQMPRYVATALQALRKEQAGGTELGAAYDIRGMGIVFGDRAGARAGRRTCAATSRCCATVPESGTTGRRASCATRSYRCCRIPESTSSRSPTRWVTSTRQ